MGVGSVVTAIVTPIALSSSGRETRQQETLTKGEKISLSDKQDYEKNCLIVAKGEDRAILICQKFSAGSETSFYLYKREETKETFDEISKIALSGDLFGTLITLTNQKEEIVTLTETQNNWKGTISHVVLENRCVVEWNNPVLEKLEVKCKSEQQRGSLIKLGEFEKFSPSKIAKISD